MAQPAIVRLREASDPTPADRVCSLTALDRPPRILVGASTGARSWVAYYPAEASSFTIEHAISASQEAVFVTGESDVSNSHGYATVAYAP